MPDIFTEWAGFARESLRSVTDEIRVLTGEAKTATVVVESLAASASKVTAEASAAVETAGGTRSAATDDTETGPTGKSSGASPGPARSALAGVTASINRGLGR